eukprot:TRINITY_DN7988_c0_g1_i1.p3 TRINITY_DN7988_c0_g1~~TRINITY_DN7988_c0_g1_i1.p3  ORF type:complete len:177 (-),score=37.64 TRINITY_DN7988_c0_g1_i1:632-1162(-)
MVLANRALYVLGSGELRCSNFNNYGPLLHVSYSRIMRADIHLQQPSVHWFDMEDAHPRIDGLRYIFSRATQCCTATRLLLMTVCFADQRFYIVDLAEVPRSPFAQRSLGKRPVVLYGQFHCVVFVRAKDDAAVAERFFEENAEWIRAELISGADAVPAEELLVVQRSRRDCGCCVS